MILANGEAVPKAAVNSAACAANCAASKRGGLGLLRQIRSEGHDCHAFVHGARGQSAPWGLFGGHEGGKCRIEYSAGVETPVRAQTVLKPGQSVAQAWLEGVEGAPHIVIDPIELDRFARTYYGIPPLPPGAPPFPR